MPNKKILLVDDEEANHRLLTQWLVTGYRQEMGDAIEKGRRIGAYTCLYKPLEMDDLFQVIEDIRIKKLQNLLVSA